MKIAQYLKRRKLWKQFKDLRTTVRYTLKSDDDILSEKKKTALRELEKELACVKKLSWDLDAEERKLSRWEESLSSLIPRSSFAVSMKGFLDVLLVACMVAGGIRALYLQPFKIPTGSMQPTLFGIHYIDREKAAPFQGPVTKLFQPLQSSRAFLKVEEEGAFQPESLRKETILFFWEKTYFRIGTRSYSLPGDFFTNIWRYVNKTGPEFRKGEVLCDGYLSSGDHVFVERLSIHFRKLKRGDVIVFNTVGLRSPTQPLAGYYYIKRLAGLPGDTLKIVDNILLVKPRGEQKFLPIYESAPKFMKLYTFKGGYLGHWADGILAAGAEITVPEGHFFALGDNTYNSLDGRNWGFIPRRNMIGLAVNIFWPVSRRWGLVDTLEPLDVDPGAFLDARKQPAGMNLQ
ncbi:MAG: signal peptidase I [Lentisphaeria bacterium]|nr:signal peptidase I [Lentisphaeria bacterium]